MGRTLLRDKLRADSEAQTREAVGRVAVEAAVAAASAAWLVGSSRIRADRPVAHAGKIAHAGLVEPVERAVVRVGAAGKAWQSADSRQPTADSRGARRYDGQERIAQRTSRLALCVRHRWTSTLSQRWCRGGPWRSFVRRRAQQSATSSKIRKQRRRSRQTKVHVDSSEQRDAANGETGDDDEDRAEREGGHVGHGAAASSAKVVRVAHGPRAGRAGRRREHAEDAARARARAAGHGAGRRGERAYPIRSISPGSNEPAAPLVAVPKAWKVS